MKVVEYEDQSSRPGNAYICIAKQNTSSMRFVKVTDVKRLQTVYINPAQVFSIRYNDEERATEIRSSVGPVFVREDMDETLALIGGTLVQ